MSDPDEMNPEQPAPAGKQEAGPAISFPMEHQAPDPSCPLCLLDDQEAYQAWEEWNPAEPSRNWAPRVEAACQRLGVTATTAQIIDHYAKHRIEQPALPGNLDYELYRRQTMSLKQRQRDLLNGVYGQRVLTSGQIREVYYRPGRNQVASKKAAQLDLRLLAQSHYLYRIFPSERHRKLRNAPKNFSSTALWYLGKRSVPFIQAAHDLSFMPPYINRASQASTETLVHDLKANEVFVSLARQINKRNGRIFTSWGEALVGYDTGNWYGPGPRSLAMGFGDPLSTDFIRIKPDGMATLSLLDRSDDFPPTLLPFFIEYDHGTKDVRDVVRQLFVYHLLARSGAVGKRFPQLDIEGYGMPVIMVFSDQKQMDLVHARFLRLAAETGIKRGSPIFLAHEEAWNLKPFAPGVVRDAWQEDRRGAFLEFLLQGNRPIWEKGLIAPGTFLDLDPDGVPARAAGAGSAAGRADGREAAREAAEQAEREERNAAVDRAIAERIARHGEKTNPERHAAPAESTAIAAEFSAAQESSPVETEPAAAKSSETQAPETELETTQQDPPAAEVASPTAEAPTAEAPTAGEAVAEAPTAGEAVAEAPTAGEAVAEEAIPETDGMVQEAARGEPLAGAPAAGEASEQNVPEQPAPGPAVDPLDPFAEHGEDEATALRRELAQIKQALAAGGTAAANTPLQPASPGFIPGLQPAREPVSAAARPPDTPAAPEAPEAPEPPAAPENSNPPAAPAAGAEPATGELPDPADLVAASREAPEPEPYVPVYAETASRERQPEVDSFTFPDLEAPQTAPGTTPQAAPPAPSAQPVPPAQPARPARPPAQPATPAAPPAQPAPTPVDPPQPAMPAETATPHPGARVPPPVLDGPAARPFTPIPEPPAPQALDDDAAAARRRARRRRPQSD